MGEALSSSETVCCSDHRVINIIIPCVCVCVCVSGVKADSADPAE